MNNKKMIIIIHMMKCNNSKNLNKNTTLENQEEKCLWIHAEKESSI